MDREQDELERIRNMITELQRFISHSTSASSSHQEKIDILLEKLPVITEKELETIGQKDSTCSICIQPFLAILAEEESASVMESPASFSGELGVTRLSQPWQCGHLFCRRDIMKWIKTGKLTCPMCRKSLVEPGSEHGSQPWQDLDTGVELHDMLANGDNADLQHLLFSDHEEIIPDSSSSEQSSGSSNSEGDSRRNYSGMYS